MGLLVEMEMPNGTVSLTIDYDAGKILIFADQRPDVQDWQAAEQLALNLGGGPWTFKADGETDVYEVGMVAGQGSVVA